MDLLKYLEPMKNIPERFSNLAFWRGVRKLKDEVVSAFEYVNSWGTDIESRLPSHEYTKSNVISLTPNVEFYENDLSPVEIFVLSSSSNGVNTILPILSIVGATTFRINLTTEKTSAIIGKHIDAIRLTYLTTDKIRIFFEMPTPAYERVWFGNGYVNGCTINQCSILGRTMTISASKMSNYENMQLDSVDVYYH